jgi:hypothetical protein
VADVDDGEGNIILDRQDRLHVVYHGRAGHGGTLARLSEDKGRSWSQSVALVPRGNGGFTGVPSLAADQAGYVHMVVGDDWETYYSMWDGSEWSRAFDLQLTLPIAAPDYSEEPVVEVVLGNEIHAVFYDGGYRLWHTMCGLEGVEPSQPVAYPDPMETPTPAGEVTIQPQASPVPTSALVRHEESKGLSPATVLWLSALLPSLIVLMAVGYRQLRHRQ